MLEYVGVDYLANMVILLRATVRGAIWVPEDSDEGTFYQRCAHRDALIIPAITDVRPLMRVLDDQGIKGIVGTTRGKPYRLAPNLFQPKLGDVASLLLSSPTSDEVIRDIGGNAWATACQEEVGSIRKQAAWIARVYALLRRLGEQVNAPSFKVSDIIDWVTLSVDWEKTDKFLAEAGVPVTSLEHVHSLSAGDHLIDDLADCDGMHAVQIVADATDKFRPRGVHASRKVSVPEVLAMLRVSFPLAELEHDEMFWQMRKWQRENAHYPMLRDWRFLDPLNVVWDQRYWESDLSSIAASLSPGEPFAVFKMDLDNFKAVNEKLGHTVGDQAICLYCEIVKRVLGSAGEVYRRGGDEIVCLAPGLSEPRAKEIAEAIRERIEAEFKRWADERKLTPSPTASIGLVVDTSRKSPVEIVAFLDAAQRKAKERGKNRVEFTALGTGIDVLANTVQMRSSEHH